MTISELIQKLEEVKAVEGDLPVYLFDEHSRVDDPGDELTSVFVEDIFDWEEIFGSEGVAPEPRRVILR